jgi:hypothetical protein
MFALDMSGGTFWAGQDGIWYSAGDPASGRGAGGDRLGTQSTRASPSTTSRSTASPPTSAEAPSSTRPAGFTPGFTSALTPPPPRPTGRTVGPRRGPALGSRRARG